LGPLRNGGGELTPIEESPQESKEQLLRLSSGQEGKDRLLESTAI
jgi:hypothetical protein